MKCDVDGVGTRALKYGTHRCSWKMGGFWQLEMEIFLNFVLNTEEGLCV